MSKARASAEDLVRRGVLVHVPPALRSYTSGRDEVLLEASDLASLLDLLDSAFPGLRDRIAEETGGPRRYVNVFVNDEQVRGPLSEARLAPGDVVHILPSVAGG